MKDVIEINIRVAKPRTPKLLKGFGNKIADKRDKFVNKMAEKALERLNKKVSAAAKQ